MMSENKCPQCGAPIEVGATECKFCGEKLATQKAAQQLHQPQPQPQVVVQQVAQPAYVSGIDPSWPVKSKITAGVLGILLGGLGVHKFYMGKIGMGIIYLVFCWTWIPGIEKSYKICILVINVLLIFAIMVSSKENRQIKSY